MFDWLKKSAPAPAPISVVLTPQPAPKKAGGRIDGKYLPLYTYLEHRYANTVVLTFQQIEDLLESALPALARTDAAWWTPGTPDARYALAWTQAEMTAKPNLLAQNVIFERAP